MTALEREREKESEERGGNGKAHVLWTGIRALSSFLPVLLIPLSPKYNSVITKEKNIGF